MCNEDRCLKAFFILVKNLNKDVILGTPFINLIKPFQVDDGVKMNMLGQNLTFEFINKP